MFDSQPTPLRGFKSMSLASQSQCAAGTQENRPPPPLFSESGYGGGGGGGGGAGPPPPHLQQQQQQQQLAQAGGGTQPLPPQPLQQLDIPLSQMDCPGTQDFITPVDQQFGLEYDPREACKRSPARLSPNRVKRPRQGGGPGA